LYVFVDFIFIANYLMTGHGLFKHGNLFWSSIKKATPSLIK